ncbi:Integrator complex subunit 3 [Spiromyces aspiralis]|uniref:Integrator complex subunit 3 n=1 Tax=Spiromyces aspiralis TaxID=68401 RepID=A0ACC1HBQ9_9FUNG|nr:Integrator complex subunit 3 [Spiromyces aspiralis]
MGDNDDGESSGIDNSVGSPEAYTEYGIVPQEYAAITVEESEFTRPVADGQLQDYDDLQEPLGFASEEDPGGGVLGMEIEADASAGVTLDESVLHNKDLWLFGQLPSQLYDDITQGNTYGAESKLNELVEIYIQSNASAEAVGDVLAFVLKDIVQQDIDEVHQAARRALSGGSDAKVEHDLAYRAFASLWPGCEQGKSQSDRVAAVLARADPHLPWLGYRWLLFSTIEHQRPDLYKEVASLARPGDIGGKLASDLGQLQDTSAMVFYDVIAEVFRAFPEETVANPAIIHTTINMIDTSITYSLCASLATGHLTLFGSNQPHRVVIESLEWESYEQSCVWRFLTSELARSPDTVTDLCNTLLLQHKLTHETYPDAVDGLLQLLCVTAPSANMLLIMLGSRQLCLDQKGQGDDPSDKRRIPDLATLVLVSWCSTHGRKVLVPIVAELAGMLDVMPLSSRSPTSSLDRLKQVGVVISKDDVKDFIQHSRNAAASITSVASILDELLEVLNQSQSGDADSEDARSPLAPNHAKLDPSPLGGDIAYKAGSVYAEDATPPSSPSPVAITRRRSTASSGVGASGSNGVSNSRSKRRRHIVESDDSE